MPYTVSEILERLPPNTELRPLDSLVPYAGNAKEHPNRQIRKLMLSIQNFGWTNFPIVDDVGNLICGHGRIEAWRRLGGTMVPVRNLGQMTEADRRAYIIADNRLAEDAKWSKSTLRSELSGLIELGYEIEHTGFDIFEVDGLLCFGEDESETAEDNIELPEEGRAVVSRLGDTWVFDGGHRLVVGDARDPQVVEQLLNGELAHMVITDPPYGVRIKNNVSGNGKVKHSDFVMGAGEVPLPEFAQTLLHPAFKVMAENCAPGAIGFVFMDWRGAPHMLAAAEGVFHEVKNMIVWVKNPGMGGFYRSAHELCYPFKISPGKHINNVALGKRNRSNVWRYPSANMFRAGRMQDLADHPTIKSKFMLRDAILDVSRPDDIVLDTFAGSGSTGLACHMSGRRARLVELDPVYADVILRRMAEATGCEPKLDGVTPLSEVAQQRAGEGA